MSLDAWSWPSRLPSPVPSPASTYLPFPYSKKTEEAWVTSTSTATSSSSGALGQHSPFHHKEGVLHGHGVPAPGRLRHSTHRAPAPFWPPSAHPPASSSCRRLGPGYPEQLARAQPGMPGPPLAQHWVCTAGRIPDSGASPRRSLLPRLLPSSL